MIIYVLHVPEMIYAGSVINHKIMNKMTMVKILSQSVVTVVEYIDCTPSVTYTGS